MHLRHFQGFNLEAGRILNRKYRIKRKLGTGWESEVYLIEEVTTEIERAAKFFHPQFQNSKHISQVVKKLHKLRHCTSVIKYHTQEVFNYKKTPYTFLVSEYVKGKLLCEFLEQLPGKRLTAFQALHLIYALTKGVQQVHATKDYIGDLHDENIIIERYGLGFDIKIIDLFHWSRFSKENTQQDIIDIIRILYDILGGQKTYAKQPPGIKKLILGLKRSLIVKEFKTAEDILSYLNNFSWNDPA